jgi:predicted dehydrogenase
MKRTVLLAGVGPHARRFYLPAIARLGPAHGVGLCAAVELEHQREAARAALAEAGLTAEVIAVGRFTHDMPAGARQTLDDAVARHRPAALIVATDPLSHRPYALWGLERGLDVLLDKPITARAGAVSDVEAARGLEADLDDILAAWRRARAKSPVVVSVCAHRRYHPGIDLALEVVRDASRRTGCPVTDVHAHHADGQWRLPAEVLTQDHHSYHAGHGKALHSGHHFFDCVHRFHRAGGASGKHADAMRVYASFVQPAGLLRQFTRADYLRLFGPAYAEATPHGDEELERRFAGFGEIDLNAAITFVQGGVAVAQASLNLLHNSFSRRCWLHPAADLYKGNGRVKHEHHRVHVGPFLAVAIHSYQSSGDHERSDERDTRPGGNNHFEVLIFRNTGMIGGEPVEVIDLDGLASFDRGRLYIEQVKEGVVGEFFRHLAGEAPEDRLRSPLADHAVPVRMLAAVYESHVRGLLGQNPVVEKPLTREEP